MSKANTPYDLLLNIVREKHEIIPSIMKETGIDCWLIFARETAAIQDPVMNLVIGGDVVWQSAFIFFIADNGAFSKTAIVGNYDADAEEQKNIWDKVIPYKEGISEPLREYFKLVNPKKIALNYSLDDVMADGLTYGMYLTLCQILSKKKDRFVSAGSIISQLRGRKSKTEIELITKACELTEEINKTVTTKLKPGMTETEIQSMYFEEMDRYGVDSSWQRSSCPAIDVPPKKIGHSPPSSEYSTRKGYTLHNDFGVKLQGYCSDLQRMWFFGTEKEIPEELQHAFETVHEAITRAAQFIKPGVTGESVDSIAREYVISRGYEEYGHGLGHQVGRKTHDGGVLLAPSWERYGDSPKGLVEENNVFTLELHVYTKNYGAVSLEENIVVTKTGCRFLVPRQEKFILVK
ncbi:MAG: M24 family metallopeptidase [Candidatus Hodarchaeota archaeon]